MSDPYEDAVSLQAELYVTASQLGAEMRKLPSTRNADAVRAFWAEIESKRARLNSLNRGLRKIDRKPRAELGRLGFADQTRRVREGKVLSQRLRIWDKMAALVERHAKPTHTEWQLRSPPQERDAMLTLLHHAVHALANPNAQMEIAKEHGCFADIAMPIKPFEDMMQAVYRLLLVLGRSDNTRFLDVGCGGGAKVLAADLYFAQCDGLDYDEEYVKAGQKTLQLTRAENARVFQADGLTFDGYAEYDVIYFYRPLRDDTLLAQLETQVVETARPGTIIAAPYDTNFSAREGFPAAKLIGPIFITGYTQDEADALLKEAEQCSTEVITRPKDMHFDPGFWSPILEAASFN